VGRFGEYVTLLILGQLFVEQVLVWPRLEEQLRLRKSSSGTFRLGDLACCWGTDSLPKLHRETSIIVRYEAVKF
jgi:hypothetical protein